MAAMPQLFRYGFMLFAIWVGVGNLFSSEVVILNSSGKSLIPLLERNAYGPGGPQAIIRETQDGPVFQASTQKDHLTTAFLAIPFKLLHRTSLMVHVEGLPPAWPLTMRIQNRSFDTLGSCDASCSVDIPFLTRSVRLAFLTKEGSPGALPSRLTLTAVYTWNWTFIGQAGGLILAIALWLVATIFWGAARRNEALQKLRSAAADWTGRYAPGRQDLKSAGDGRRYWGWVAVVIATYAFVWIVNFRYVYGWLEDDWCVYMKAMATLRDPRDAFFVRLNLLQPYFFLFSYLPLKLGLRLPSIDIPVFDNQTGLFRGLLFYTLCYHIGIASAWAWLAEKLCWRKLAAFLSVVFLLLSPTFVLWTPQPDTRIVGLPLVLVGIWLLIRSPQPRPLQACFAGLLFSVANNLHYTSMYLTVPAGVVLFGLDALGRWYREDFWKTWIWFGAGVAGVIVSLELASRYWVRYPFDAGPLAMLFHQSDMHRTSLTRFQGLALWGEFDATLIGVPMLLAGMIGMVILIKRRGSAGPDRGVRIALVSIYCLGMAIILLSPSIPFFRQTSVLQPFLFLFAATAIAECVYQVRSVAYRAMLLLILATLVTAIPAARAYETFQAHLGLGKAVHWVAEHKGPRRICWFFKRVEEYSPAEYIASFSADDWAVINGTKFRSDLSNPLYDVPPLASFPGIWGTQICYAETFAWNHADLRKSGFSTETRVYRIGDITAALQRWNQRYPAKQPLPGSPAPLVSRIEPIPASEQAMDRLTLMRSFLPLPDPLRDNVRVRVFGTGLGEHSVLTLEGIRVPTRVDDYHTSEVRLIAAIPSRIQGCMNAFVEDGGRRSNLKPFCIPR